MDDISIEAGDMEDLLQKNEYLDIRDYVEEAQHKEAEYKRKQEEAAAAARKGRGR